MSLSPGTRLGPYEVIGPIGAGGMGEVYRARDTHLGRDVAIKALPSQLASDPERVARFQREAQVLAALNHPNIAGIHGLEEAHGAKFLVLEFVDGITLAARIGASRRHSVPAATAPSESASRGAVARGGGAPGAIDIEDAIAIARQIIDALEAAHDKGIVHRDLKPANIMLTWRGAPLPRSEDRRLEPTFSAADVADATVKVLDFGLARVVESDPTASASNSPTLTFAATQVGIILGTAAYMSPEQAKGRVADKRSDVWAFGCVLYEMLTGKRVFEGEDVSDTLAAVLRADPDWTALPADVPEGIRSLLKRCLERDRKTRIPDMAVVRFLLQDAVAPTPAAVGGPVQATPARTGRLLLVAVAGLATGIALTAGVVWALAFWTPALPSPPVMRFAITPPAGQNLGPTITDRQLAISPDGTHLVYVGGSSTSGGQLILRSIDRLDAAPLAGVTGARNPFFSADGKWIGFFQGNNDLRKVSVTGGPSISLSPLDGATRGGTWAPDDTIIFATSEPSGGLQSVPSGGGVPKRLTTPDAAKGEGDHILPSVLPNGRGVLFTIAPPVPNQIANAQIAVLDLATGRHTILIRGGSHASYAEPGYLVYAATGSSGPGNVAGIVGSLRAVRFDPVGLEVLSDPVPVLENIAIVVSGAAQFTLSRTGTLVYVPGSVLSVVGGGNPRSLVWVNRQGREEPIKAAPPRAYFNLRLSPDGTRVALDIRDQENDIWVWDLSRQNLMKITFDQGADLFPIWTHDSRRILFGSARSGSVNLYWQAADGTGTVERLTTASYPQYPMSLSLDGKQLLVNELKAGQNADISVLALDGKAQPTPLIQSPALERTAEVSPDGRWVAYESDEQSGRAEIYVRPFPDINNGRWQVSTAGGTKPAWSPTGRELFYIDGNSFLTTVPVQTTPSFKAGNPTKLFEARNIATLSSARFYDVSRDGQRFIMIKELAPPPGSPQAAGPAGPTFVVVLNWAEDVRARVGR